MKRLERFIEQYDPSSFGFACVAIFDEEDGSVRRCGKQTHRMLVIGDNGFKIPYCDEHMPSRI